MSAITDGGWPNLANITTRLDPDGSAAYVSDVLSKKNPILDDIPWMEGNLPTGHQITLSDTSLPTATWRTMNQGVVSTKGKTAQYVESCGVLECHSRVDERIAELNGGAPWRESEDKLHMEGVAQQFATALFYESVGTNPERIHGLSPRYPATSGYTASSYVLAPNSSGSDAHSVWLITWEPRKCCGIYPKGTQAGIDKEDMGRIPVTDSQSPAGTLFMWLTKMVWRCGIAVEDYRYAVRGQWDPGDAAMADDDRGLYGMMTDMLGTIYEVTPNTRFYMNRTSLKKLNRQLLENESRPLTYMNVHRGSPTGDQSEMGGQRVPEFMGIPIRVTDALVAETALS